MADGSASTKLEHELVKSNSSNDFSDEIEVSGPGLDDFNQSLSISFQRTIRVADNAEANDLPPDFGCFPIFCTEDFKETLPAHMSGKDGYFISMHQREAMWIKFTAHDPFAIKIYVGGVNAVSGEPARETPMTLVRRTNRLLNNKSIQDYVVVPGQLWLDGIASDDGRVRQFVAMPLGDGYTVEAQITGEEAVGGLQFEVVPRKVPRPEDYFGVFVKTLTGRTITLRLTSMHTIEELKRKVQDSEGLPPDHQRLIYGSHELEDSLTVGSYKITSGSTVHLALRLRGGGNNGGPKSSRSGGMGIAAGGLISQSIVKDKHDSCIWDPNAGTIFNIQILNSVSCASVTWKAPSETPLSAAVYAKYGFPYFKIFDEKPSGINGNFGGVKSVNEMDWEGEPTKEKAEAVADAAESTNNQVVLLDDKGNRVGFRTVSEMEKAVRDRFGKMAI